MDGNCVTTLPSAENAQLPLSFSISTDRREMATATRQFRPTKKFAAWINSATFVDTAAAAAGSKPPQIPSASICLDVPSSLTIDGSISACLGRFLVERPILGQIDEIRTI